MKQCKHTLMEPTKENTSWCTFFFHCHWSVKTIKKEYSLYSFYFILASKLTFGNVPLVNIIQWGENIINLMRPFIEWIFITIFQSQENRLRFCFSYKEGTLDKPLVSTRHPQLWLACYWRNQWYPLHLWNLALFPNGLSIDGFKEVAHRE